MIGLIAVVLVVPATFMLAFPWVAKFYDWYVDWVMEEK